MGSFFRRLNGRLASALPVAPAIRQDDAPLCSFTFDDCPASALEHGGALLESLGTGGTFFISAGLSRGPEHHSGRLMWGAELAAAAAAGHEIGGHTFSHRSMPTLDAEEIREEFRSNRAALREVMPELELTSFAYPFGEVSLTAKRQAARTFKVSRGVRQGVNGRVLDLSELRAVHLFSPTLDRAYVRAQVARASRDRGWIVFLTHDIRQDPTDWGCTPGEFDFAVDEVRKAGIEILTINAGLERVQAGRAPGRRPSPGARGSRGQND